MNNINTVMIISDKQELVSQISQKLVLLRELDKIKSSTLESAMDLLEEFFPNIIILHCENNNTSALNLIKSIKKQEKYKNLPILFICDNCTREIVIEAFDSGISDVLFTPIIDYELIIRVIWCLKQNEANIENESKIKFLSQIGVIEEETGVYSKDYCNSILKNRISETRNYSQNACILLITPDKNLNEDRAKYINIIKNSIRLNDTIIEKDNDSFYIYLQKTKLNGAYSVFERIVKNALSSAGVIEVLNQDYEDIKSALQKANERAVQNPGSLIVTSEFYSESEKPEINLDFPNNFVEEKEIEKEQIEEAPPQKLYASKSVRLFNKMYASKLNVVILPVFNKYSKLIASKYPNLQISSNTGQKSYFRIAQGNANAILEILYDGVEKVTINVDVVDNGRKRVSENETIKYTLLSHNKISNILEEMLNQLLSILK